MAETYESIIQLHDDEAREALRILDADGERVAIEHLEQWYEPGEGTLVSTRGMPWRAEDERFERGDYVMYANRRVPYIGLVRKVSV